tara:strand:- start:6542 stop:7144 length:603 start_codon:yes stop_codon:yes gene_type:complete
MADKTPFTEIRLRAGDVDKSANWYQQQVRSYARHLTNPNELYQSDLGKFATQLEVGKMYLFEYDPKTKADLPYYDNFPLIIMVDQLPKGFSGINLHYLPPLIRAKLLDKLMPATEMESDTTLRSSWPQIRNFSRFPELRGAVKKYLSQQAGKMYEINPFNWKSAIFLPVQQFKGGVGPQEIYRNTMERPERKRRNTIGGF